MELSGTLIAQVLLKWILFIPVLTLHEFAHAWTAWKCGDDTAYKQGRVSLNPIVHMEVIGTVVLPLVAIFLGMTGSALAGFIIGWGKPVPVNWDNLSRPRLQDSLIAMAGPAMNFLLAGLLFGILKFAPLSGADGLREITHQLIFTNLILCFFNLIPIPPLDGSHILLHLTRMSFEVYFRIAQFGFILVIAAMNMLPIARFYLLPVMDWTYLFFAKIWRLPP
jgi:Zn-dependent protease